MRVLLASVAILVALIEAQAKETPFGQETVEVRSWRNPPRPDVRPALRHKHGSHDHRKGGHDHKHGAHSHGPGAQDHPHGHGHAHGVDTEHLFGFTKGSDIDPPPGRHFISDLTGSFVKGSGSYSALSQHSNMPSRRGAISTSDWARRSRGIRSPASRAWRIGAARRSKDFRSNCVSAS